MAENLEILSQIWFRRGNYEEAIQGFEKAKMLRLKYNEIHNKSSTDIR